MHLNEIRKALSELKPEQDSHWTEDGLPSLGALKNLLGGEMVRRAMVLAAAPEFTRSNPKIPMPDAPSAQLDLDDREESAEDTRAGDTREEDIASTTAAVAEMQAELTRIDQQILDLNNRRQFIHGEQAKLQTKLDRLVLPTRFEDSNAAYKAAMDKKHMERVQAAKAAEATQPKDVRAPIDIAFQKGPAIRRPFQATK